MVIHIWELQLNDDTFLHGHSELFWNCNAYNILNLDIFYLL